MPMTKASIERAENRAFFERLYTMRQHRINGDFPDDDRPIKVKKRRSKEQAMEALGLTEETEATK